MMNHEKFLAELKGFAQGITTNRHDTVVQVPHLPLTHSGARGLLVQGSAVGAAEVLERELSLVVQDYLRMSRWILWGTLGMGFATGLLIGLVMDSLLLPGAISAGPWTTALPIIALSVLLAAGLARTTARIRHSRIRREALEGLDQTVRHTSALRDWRALPSATDGYCITPMLRDELFPVVASTSELAWMR